MSKYEFSIGVDVSKKTLSICVYNDETIKYFETGNSPKSFKKSFLDKEKDLDFSKCIFMFENTGVYHLKVATYLVKDLGYTVSVANPLAIKRFMEMGLSRVKTDKADSMQIAKFGYSYGDEWLYEPKSELNNKIELTLGAIDDFHKQINILTNQLESLETRDTQFKDINRYYKNMIKSFQLKIKELEKSLDEMLKKNYKEEYELIKSIPGAGVKFCSLVLGKLNRFSKFKRAKQVVSYLGICPSPYESGTSVKGRGKISKRGSSYARKILFMCSFSACKHNKQCADLYSRMVAAGKAKKVALIAVTNKLIRQAFGILKSGKPYNANYLENLTLVEKNA